LTNRIPPRRSFLKNAGGLLATSVVGTSPVLASEAPEPVYKFDVSKLPASLGYLEDPKGRQREAWNLATEIHQSEQSASNTLNRYSTEDIVATVNTASAARTDLRSFSRLVEVLHENNLAKIIDVSLLNSIGKRADIVVRYAPLLGSVNNVLNKAEAFATAIKERTEFSDGLSELQRTRYLDFVLSIACLCLEVGLIWVGAPFKLAWKGTHQIFFARSGTLFRLGRYGGDRFVAFFMSEVHWELREALFDDVVTTEKARWVTNEVNEFRREPQFTELKNDADSLIDNRPEFQISDYKSYWFGEKQTDKVVDAGSDILGEAVELLPKHIGKDNVAQASLVLNSTTDWSEGGSEDESSWLP
jgi:hypothetical protein